MHHKYGKDSKKSWRRKMDRRNGNVKKLGWSNAGRVIQSYKQIHRFNEQLKEVR